MFYTVKSDWDNRLNSEQNKIYFLMIQTFKSISEVNYHLNTTDIKFTNVIKIACF